MRLLLLIPLILILYLILLTADNFFDPDLANADSVGLFYLIIALVFFGVCFVFFAIIFFYIKDFFRSLFQKSPEKTISQKKTTVAKRKSTTQKKPAVIKKQTSGQKKTSTVKKKTAAKKKPSTVKRNNIAQNRAKTAKRLKKILSDIDKSKKESLEFEAKLSAERLRKNKVNSLWHLTHRDNIKNILIKGIMNHQAAQDFDYVDISNQGVQDRRIKKEPIHGRKIHEYAPLFINPKNAMLYSIKKERNELCLVEVSLDVLECEYIFTDGNAARIETSFYGDTVDRILFEQIPWDTVFSESWTQNYERNETIMSHMQSEFLIYPSIKPKYIKKIHCYSKDSVTFLKDAKIAKPILLNSPAFTFEFE